MEVKKRISYPLGMFDLVKGLGMIEVVLFHTTSYLDISPWLCAIVQTAGYALMGVFLTVNGFSFRQMPVKASVKKYAKTYLIPYFRLAFLVIVSLLLTAKPISNIVRYALAFALGILYDQQIGSLLLPSILLGWFFLALFWGSILLNLVLKIDNRRLRVLCIFGITAIGIYFEHISLYLFCFCRGCQALPVMYFGYYAYSQNLLSRIHSVPSKTICYLLFFATMLIGYFLRDVDEMIFSLLILCQVIWGLVAICFAKDTASYSNWVLELIRKIGRYSYWVIIGHTLEIICFPWYVVTLDRIDNADIRFWTFAIFRGIVIFLICIALQRIDRLERQYHRKRRHAHR